MLVDYLGTKLPFGSGKELNITDVISKIVTYMYTCYRHYCSKRWVRAMFYWMKVMYYCKG